MCMSLQSVTLQLFLPWTTFKFSFVYIWYSQWTCFQRALCHLKHTSADEPDLISWWIWTSLNNHLKAAGKQTKKKVSPSGGWDCAESSLCEVLGLSAPSLSLFAGRMGGDGDERGISLTRVFLQQSTDSIESHSFPHCGVTLIILLHWTALWKNKGGLICRRHTSFLFPAGPTEIPLISSCFTSLTILRF